MQNYFSISEAAKLAGLTSETLRHYDRIGLVKPSQKDPWTKYRYYTKPDIVRLSTVHALSRMDLSLKEIKEVLEYDDLSKIIAFLQQAEHRADEKIRELEYGKAKLRLARASYEQKLGKAKAPQSTYTQDLPARVILLSDTLEEPSLENLWNYLSHFYSLLPEEERENFAFEDLAGVYREPGSSKMFALCLEQGHSPNLKTLPAGTYLCTGCAAEDWANALENLKQQAKTQYGVEPEFAVQLIVLSGILQWTYQLQVLINSHA